MAEKLGYRPELDGLRALAIIGVMGAHLGIPWALGGAIGVHLFFTLSGFLITRLLLEEHARSGGINVVQFWLRRTSRLMPGALALLAASAAYAVVLADPANRTGTLRAIPAVAGYVANWRRQSGDAVGALGHMWSLSVEEQFYLVWPLALIALVAGFGPSRRLGWFLGAGSLLACTALRVAIYSPGSPVVFRTDFVADLLLVGCAAALVSFLRPVVVPGWLAAAAAAWFAVDVVFYASGGFSWQYTWAVGIRAVAAATIVVHLTGGGAATRALSAAPLVAVGRLSYSLYLWHVLAYYIGASWSPLGRVALAVVLAWFSYCWIEQPLRRRLSPDSLRRHPRVEDGNRDVQVPSRRLVDDRLDVIPGG